MPLIFLLICYAFSISSLMMIVAYLLRSSRVGTAGMWLYANSEFYELGHQSINLTEINLMIKSNE